MSYFVRIKGNTFGPFDESQLLDMKSKGKITRGTEVSKNSRNDWQSAESFLFLYEPVLAAPEPRKKPFGGKSADWFYSLNGKEGHGPVTASVIEQMLQSGLLKGKSYVWQQGQNAGFIKDEPRFSGLVGSSSSSVQEAPPAPAEDTKYKANQVYEITSAEAPADAAQKHHYETKRDPIPVETQPLSRHTFIFLAAFPFTGMAGIHAFYAKRYGLGAVHVGCLGPWILAILFTAISAVLGSLGVHVRVDWFDSVMTPSSISALERTGAFMIFLFVVLPLASYVHAMIDIVCITKDGFGREMERV